MDSSWRAGYWEIFRAINEIPIAIKDASSSAGVRSLRDGHTRSAVTVIGLRCPKRLIIIILFLFSPSGGLPAAHHSEERCAAGKLCIDCCLFLLVFGGGFVGQFCLNHAPIIAVCIIDAAERPEHVYVFVANDARFASVRLVVRVH